MKISQLKYLLFHFYIILRQDLGIFLTYFLMLLALHLPVGEMISTALICLLFVLAGSVNSK